MTKKALFAQSNMAQDHIPFDTCVGVECLVEFIRYALVWLNVRIANLNSNLTH